MIVSLPSSFVDVSDMRPVPDHQEVFCDTSSSQSLVFEIVEMGPSSGVIAAYYLRDWMEQNEATTSETHAPGSSHQTVDSSLLTESLSPHCAVYLTSSKVMVGETKVLIHLAVLRLARVASDLIITLNIPQEEDTDAGNYVKLLLELILSLDIADWSLFG